jgi:hypothetical protein
MLFQEALSVKQYLAKEQITVLEHPLQSLIHIPQNKNPQRVSF